MRLVPLFPYAAVNYLSGLTAVRVRDYTIGIVPATTAYAVIGAYGAHPGSAPFLLSLGVLVALTIGALLAARRRSRHRGLSEHGDPGAPAATGSAAR